MSAPTVSAREGYRLWAPSYAEETAVSALEDAEVRALGVAVTGVRLLDVGCGVGRRLWRSRASLGVGVDLVPEMLRVTTIRFACAAADVRALPFGNDSFDVVWCRLVLGHVRDIEAAYQELGRVCASGGVVIVSDLHVAAVAAGHRRTFRDESGSLRELEHYVHDLAECQRAARRSSLSLETHRVGRVGPSIEPFYRQARREDAYAAQFALPLVAVMAWRKSAEAA